LAHHGANSDFADNNCGAGFSFARAKRVKSQLILTWLAKIPDKASPVFFCLSSGRTLSSKLAQYSLQKMSRKEGTFVKQYLDLMRHVRDNGIKKEDRTGTGTISVFGYQMRFNLADGFPVVTTKKLHLRSIIHELLWFLKGDTNIQYLKDNKVRIWDEWADEDGNLGPVYGSQWRSWPTADGRHIDQITQVVDQIKNNPELLKNMLAPISSEHELREEMINTMKNHPQMESYLKTPLRRLVKMDFILKIKTS
jgi:hypothetical protein